MIPADTLHWGTVRNCIRELYEYGVRQKAKNGEDSVFDFSIGNPSIPTPKEITEAIRAAADEPTLHDYTVAPGRPGLRRKVSERLNALYGLHTAPEDVYITCGASAAVSSSLKGLVCPGEEVIGLAPHYPEYPVFTRSAKGIFKSVSLRHDDLQLDGAALRAALTEKTAALIVNSPNNPSGAVLTEKSLTELADILREAQEKYGHPIYLISDEPYRELVYDGITVPGPACYYENTVICYSFSKSLSLPGERIGYYAVSDRMAERDSVFASVAGAARAYGYVNAPSLMQLVLERVPELPADIEAYRKNRALLCALLDRVGFSYVKPDGAFYLFMRSPIPDAKRFSEIAKRYNLLLVPSNDFGMEGYVRLAYCVPEERIIRSEEAFRALRADADCSE